MSRVIKGAAKYGAGAARAVARSAGDVIRSMSGHAFAKMAAEQAAKRIPPSTFAALRKPMLAAKDLVVSSLPDCVAQALDGGKTLEDLEGAYVGYVPSCPSCQRMFEELGFNRAKKRSGK